MRIRHIVLGILVAIATATVGNAPAFAQSTRTWVSGVGDDANPCSRTAPCKTFAGAISKTAAGGEISVLDPGGFGAVTITKSISIINYDSGEAGILASGTNAVIVNAGANDVVILRGLLIDGGTPSVPGLNGVRFLAGGALHVIDSIIKNFRGAAPNGNGILFAPSGASELFVTNTYISESAAGGILIQPTGGGSAKVTIQGTTSVNNTAGIRADGTGSTGGIAVSITDSVVAGNSGAGFVSFTPAGGAAAKMMISRSTSANNATGLNANGGTMRIGASVVVGNGTAATVAGGGTMSSYNNNQIDDNTAAGSAIPTIAPH